MSNPTVTITVLVEDSAAGRGLRAEHGLSFWIQTPSANILFDTGQGLVLQENAHKLNIPLQDTDAVVISHGHYDHTGGIFQILNLSNHTRIYAHPAILQSRYSRKQDGSTEDVSAKLDDCGDLCSQLRKFVGTEHPTRIADGIYATGQIPRVTDYEDTGGPFFVDRQCQHPDAILDDQAIYIETTKGTAILLGCAHAGVINTVEYIRQLTADKPICLLAGGMHLVAAGQERIAKTIDHLQQLNIPRIGPAHCTGPEATAALWSAFPKTCFSCRVGTTLQYTLNQS